MDERKPWFLIENFSLRAWQEKGAPPLSRVKARSRTLCLVHHARRWYALDHKCPHAGGPLSAGHINEQQQLVCPWHRFAFDLDSGQSESGGYFVNSYPVKEEGDQLWVRFPRKKKWWFW